MNRLPLYLLALLLLCGLPARAQFGSFGDVPIEINAEETKFDSGVAIAEGNVVIRYGLLSVYADYAQYNPDTRDVLVLGNVRIYQGKEPSPGVPLKPGESTLQTFAGERAVYNLETKQLTAADMRTSDHPFFVSAGIVSTLGPNAFLGREVTATTHDSSKPDYHLRARTMRLYAKDRVIFRDVTLYLGQTPVFWLPFVYQNLNKEQGFTFTPGYTSNLGALFLTRYNFPLGDNLGVSLRLDYLSDRGFGAGLEAIWGAGTKKESWGRFKSYIIDDQKADSNITSLSREPIDAQRYRVTFQDRTYITDDIYASIDITKLSDARYFQDFEPGEFQRNPNPDNMIALVKASEDYTVTLLGRARLNDFFDFTERLPEIALDVKRQPIFGDSGLFYDGESSGGFLRRNFANNSIFADFDTYRIDSFHQVSFPKTLFGWLNLVPHAGVRGTFYGDSGHFKDAVTRIDTFDTSGRVDGFQESAIPQFVEGGSTGRFAANANIEASFKLSKAYEGVQSRPWGLDGLRHIFQPYLNYSFVYSNKDASDLLQFDRINPSTRQPPIDFPMFNSVDSIESWNILRIGAHNRFQTRRDNDTFLWMEINTFLDIRFQRPEFEKTFLALPQRPDRNRLFDEDDSLLARVGDPGTFSNLYNDFEFSPVPWVALRIDSQVPLLDEGFFEINSRVNFLLTSDVQFSLSHRYLSGNKLFQDSSELSAGMYLRMGENWGLSLRETYEFATGVLQTQRYELHRDLSSWVASFGFIIQDNGGGQKDYGVALTFTLKDLPIARLPFNLDPGDVSGLGGGSKNQ